MNDCLGLLMKQSTRHNRVGRNGASRWNSREQDEHVEVQESRRCAIHERMEPTCEAGCCRQIVIGGMPFLVMMYVVILGYLEYASKYL